MKYTKFILTVLFSVSVVFFVSFNDEVEAKPTQFLNNHLSIKNKSQTDTIKVDGVEYLVVETNNGVGVTLKLNKSNLRKLAEMVSEISDEMDSEKFNNIIQGK